MQRRVRRLTALYLGSCSVVILSAVGPANAIGLLRRQITHRGDIVRDITLAGPTVVSASERPAPDAGRPAQAPSARGQHYQLPIGTILSARLRTTVSSISSSVDDQVDASLTEAVTRDGVELIPAGSLLHGRVTDVVTASRKVLRGRVSIEFAVVQHDATSSRAAIRTRPIALEPPPDDPAAAPRSGKPQPVDVTVASGHPLQLVLAEPLLVLIPATDARRR